MHGNHQTFLLPTDMPTNSHGEVVYGIW